ncbi:hypothetical protein V1517DRAFT_333695 [Lipomyces orientalis]|uniref:Uncharacterized protein n=1 Tax=Lipomyces orientalis TaxID=1233043 RepID=A0ACC3TD53_9ASCO
MSMSAARPIDQVRVTSRHTLRCANEATLATIESPFKLGPMDQLVLPFVPIAVVYVYKQPVSNSSSDATRCELIPVGCLQRALTQLLELLPASDGSPADKPG